MLARVLAMVLYQSSIETAKRVGLVFGMGASFYPTLYCRKFGYLQIARNSGLRKFRHGISIVERALNLARERWTIRA